MKVFFELSDVKEMKMATYKVVKGSVSVSNLWLYKFTRDLVSCVEFACKQVAREISGQPDSAFGTEHKIAKGAVTNAGLASQAFSQAVVAPHANAYARHLMEGARGKTNRMDLGNLVEQYAADRMEKHYTGWKKDHHYLYQVSVAQPPRFPVNYMGNTKSARPDFRYEFFSGTPNGDEAVFDITTTAQAGHLLNKKIGGTSIQMHARIPVAVEIIWTDSDLYNA